jgi:DNA primase
VVLVHNGVMADTVQQIKDKLSIQDVVSGYVKLERSGSSWRARCPFHAERTPSFHVSVDRGTYHCFGCGVGGDIFSFVQAIEGLDFKGALKILAERAGVKIEHRGGREEKDDTDRLFELLEIATIFFTGKLNDTVRAYLKKRGITDATVREFRLGWAGDAWSDVSDHLRGKKFSEREIVDAGLAKRGERGGLIDKFRNRIMFPISDSAGRVVGFSGRTFGEDAHPDAPKYLNSPETPLYRKSRILYGFDRAKQAIRKHNFAVLVEGQLDLLSSHQAGWTNTVAVSGTAFTPEHATLLRRMADNLLIALDADEAGIKAASRAARVSLGGGLNVKVAALPDGLDPADLILQKGADDWRTAIREAKDIITFLLDVLEKHSKKPDQFRRAVETIVLPFLSDVQSPIAREQYVREVAGRLGVSESAVSEALAKVPRTPEASAKEPQAVAPKQSDRVKNAFAVLLWQQSVKKPELDTSSLLRELEKVVGKTELAALQTLPESEQEQMRFSAERLYGKSKTLAQEVKMLLAVLRKEKLTRELADATSALKKAESADDDAAIKKWTERCKELTGEIAKL